MLHPLNAFLILLLAFVACSEAAKKKVKPKGDDESSSVAGRPSLSSGELSTKEGHRCTWEAQEGRNNNIMLQVNCVPSEKEEGDGSKHTYSCQFSGKPQECPAYVDKPTQYWKQVVGKLKKRTNACEGEKVLKTRLCKKAPSAAHMKLAEKKGEGQNDGGRKKGAGNKDGEKEKQAKEEVKDEEQMQGDSDDSFGEVNDGAAESEAAESYCGEGWNSVCRFFTKLLDG